MWRWCRSLAACSTSTTVASYLTYGDDSAGAGAFGDGGQMVGMTLAGSVYTTSYTY